MKRVSRVCRPALMASAAAVTCSAGVLGVAPVRAQASVGALAAQGASSAVSTPRQSAQSARFSLGMAAAAANAVLLAQSPVSTPIAPMLRALPDAAEGTGMLPGSPRAARMVEALPQSPGAVKQAEQPGLCTLEGKVRGTDGGIIPGAVLTLLGEGQVRERVEASDGDGEYRMEHVPCGQFVLSVTMAGFRPVAVGGSMPVAGSAVQQDVLLRTAGVNASVNVVASTAEIAQAEVHLQEQQRLLGAFPNYFVSYQWSAVPLHARQKFGLALHTAADPVTVAVAAGIAGVQQADGSLPGYGTGAAGYGRRFGANMGNAVVGTFLGGAILPTIFRQDPRYFYRGTGSTKSRLWYAVSRAFVTRGDSGRTEVNYSGLLGDLGTGAISNLYAAEEDREGASLTVSNGLIAIAGDCVNYTLQEFWLRKLTTRTRGRRGKASDRP